MSEQFCSRAELGLKFVVILSRKEITHEAQYVVNSRWMEGV